MKTIITTLVGFLLFWGSHYLDKKNADVNSLNLILSVMADCQPEITKNRAIMERYLTDSQPDSIRQATGTDGLLVSQIQVVQSTDSACTALNAEFPSSLAELIPETSTKMFNFTFYEVGDFYFVIKTPNPSPDPSIFVLTRSALWIYDDSFDMIAGYSF